VFDALVAGAPRFVIWINNAVKHGADCPSIKANPKATRDDKRLLRRGFLEGVIDVVAYCVEHARSRSRDPREEQSAGAGAHDP
jgi:hypothetical protein